MIKYLVVTSACLAASASALCSFKTQGIDGAGCWDLGVACGYDMSVASQSNAFYSYNPNIKPDCSNLAPGQRVCCNAGGLAPPPNSDGSCAVYAVKTGDNCGTIGGYYGLTIDQIDGFNLKDSTSFGGTWGYRGCSNLQPGNICISKGTSGPVPAKSADPEVQCGPTASGNGTNIKCPLNVCCNEWGHCGLTSEFCDIVPDVNPGVKGCQDECDRDFIMSDPPSQFISVGYFESWNIQWPCLNTRISKQKLDQYTHIHYSFADIGMDLKITLDEYAQAQFAEFKAISKKKIISFGGWGISTDADTHPHLPNAALPQNRAQAARNMVNFMTANGLDGIDIDWEYPEKPDSPGMGSAGEAENYLELLKAIRSILPEGKSLSIAAPASFWYLKAFPIEEMAKHLDYIVYMTYDLHGQWDYGNKWAQVGCEGGDCLRSHTNWTETLDSLSMITHAGVPSNKVLLGLAAYGRSFGQTDPNCHGPDCRYSGPISGATPGSCTANPGTLALAEVNRIRQSGRTRYEYSDSESQIMLYDDNQWVAFNTEAQLENRRYKAMKMNLGGTVTWALDSIGDASNAVDPCDVVSMTMEELQLSTCSSDTLISGMRAYILSIISSLQGLPQSTLDRLKLDPKDRIKQLQDLLLSLDAIETTALLGKRDFLDVGDISFIKQVADAGMAYANSVKNNIVVINVDLLTYEQAEALYQRVMLEISNGNLLPAQVLLGFYVATASVIVIHDVYYASDNILYLSFETYAKWKKNCIKWYWHAHQYFQDMFDECVSKKDIEINIIVDNTTIIEPEDVAGPGKTQDTASVLMPDVSSDTCPLMDVFSYSVHEAVTGMQKTLGYRSWSYDKNGNKQCDMPVYYINLHGQSKGVASVSFMMDSDETSGFDVYRISNGEKENNYIDQLVTLVFYSTDELGYGEWHNNEDIRGADLVADYPVEPHRVSSSTEAFNGYVERICQPNGYYYPFYMSYMYLSECFCDVYIPGWKFETEYYGDYDKDNLELGSYDFWMMRLRFDRLHTINAITTFLDRGSLVGHLLSGVISQNEIQSMEAVEHINGHTVIGKDMVF
ncbi:hypothetical protein IWW48_005743 [Coemansia sp. RSA 1200]|nr:hypothetical protein IWW48_005743 [Coemansia sp. RSA 1200]